MPLSVKRLWIVCVRLMLLVLLPWSVAPARGQNDTAKPRPKIGLALAGGAALGLAHIGVLKWFEEHHIPVDYLTGTSMGGLIGGGYATGLSPDEMSNLIKSLDWNQALSGQSRFEDLPFRRKEDQRSIPTRLVLGLRGGVTLPDGIIPANAIGLLLSRISLPYSALPSFDDLPIPFRCIAVDMAKGQAVALHDGSLETALRATMAIPGVFSPVQRDGMTLTDGGTLNNIPTEAVKQMGAGIIIAVDLSASFLTPKPLKSLVDVAGQALNISVYANERRSLQLADIVIAPDLDKLNSFGFTQVDAFIARGYQAAQAHANILQRLALDEADWKDYVARRERRKRTPITTPAFLAVEGGSKRPTEALTKQLQPFAGHPLDLTRLERQLTQIPANGRYESFLYEQARRNGQDGLLIRAKETSYAPPYLRLGLEVNGADTDNIGFDLAARLIMLDVGSPGSEVRANLRLGTDKQLDGEYYYLLNGRRWFLAPRLFYQDNNISLFQNGLRVAVYGARAVGSALDFGYNPDRRSEARLGLQLYYASDAVRTGDPALPSLSGLVSAASFRWAYDDQDSPIIPTRGSRWTMQSNWYFRAPGAAHPFPTVQFDLNRFVPLHNGNLLFGILGAGTTFGAQASPLQQFTLGGPLRLGAYGPNELRGNDFLLLSGGYLHRLMTLPSFLGGKVMAGAWYEFGGAFSDFASGQYRSDLSIGFVAETLLGPVVLGGSFGEAGRSSVYFGIGRLF